jgi:class 3 adenylate cyclase/tetratricopeptide (TPR) repeat protein/Arc/MetJ family transcription regulator
MAISGSSTGRGAESSWAAGTVARPLAHGVAGSYTEGVERKLATVLFVDLVDSTSLVTASDPEIVRRRVTQYFDSASRSIEQYGGTVEKFVGDAVMAAFGVPQAHEDDAERAVRAAFAVLDAVHELGLEARIGIESGEVVVDDGDSTFATGEAVNLAARLQQAGSPGEIVLGPGARRLTVTQVEVEDRGPVQVRGREPVWSWRAVGVLEGRERRAKVPFIGREAELDLLRNIYERSVRERRTHLVTVFGDPGIGKSRFLTEFTGGVERATVLTGRALPYGEGVSYWPIASMVKESAGITDDDPAAEAFEKLRLSCESDAVADLLSVALGLLGAAENAGAGEEIKWAALRWAEQLATTQPLVLVFEDVQWADERMLDVIEHLAHSLKSAPLLVVCLARQELLDSRPSWGGGNPRATGVELASLTNEEAWALADALLPRDGASAEVRRALLERAEGNPLFLEETALMLLEADAECDDLDGIPDTVQAMIAARIDLLEPEQKRVLQRAAVIGRVFWRGALERLAPDLDVGPLLDSLLQRDLIAPEDRSTISGDRAYQFRHLLIHDVAYGGMTKVERAENHQIFAAWLGERAPDELVEIRAHHFDRACALIAELDGRVPEQLASEAAQVLEDAGDLACRKDSFTDARRLYLRALELAPTLERHYLAAEAAEQLGELGVVAEEMELVRAKANETSCERLEGRALNALAGVALNRDGDPQEATRLAQAALEVLSDDDFEARLETLGRLAAAAWWPGDLRTAETYIREAAALAERSDRRDLWILAAANLVWLLELRLDLDGADTVLRELGPPGEGVLERARAHRATGSLRRIQGRLDEAAVALDESHALYLDAGAAGEAAWLGVLRGWVAFVDGDLERAERDFRHAIRVFTMNEDHGHLCEAQRALAETLLETGRVDEAERYALAAHGLVSGHDLTSRSSTTRTLGVVRAAQGRDAEAESLLRDALALLEGTDFRLLEVEALVPLARFLRARERCDEADKLEARLPARIPGWLGATDLAAPTGLPAVSDLDADPRGYASARP